MLASLVSSEAFLSSWVADGCVHMAFSLCMSIPGVQISSSYKDTSHTRLKVKVKVSQLCPVLCDPGLISFRMDWLDLLAVHGSLKSLLQHHSSKASILLCSAFFIV